MARPAERAPLDYQELFRMLPERHVVIKANDPDFTFVDASDPDDAPMRIKSPELIGKGLFEVYPDTSEKFKKTGVSEVTESLRKVIRTGKPNKLPVVRFDVRDADGAYQVRYWSSSHYPLFDSKGKVAYVVATSRDVTAEVVAEQNFKQVQTQLDQALSAGLIGIWNWDIKANKLVADRNLAAMFGIDEDQAKEGLALENFLYSVHKDDRERVTATIEKVLAERGSIEIEYRTQVEGAATRWVIVRGRVEVDERNNPSNFLGVLVDITDRKLAEQQLEESNQNFQNLADAMPQLVWVARADGHHEYYNRAWYDYTGIVPELSNDRRAWNEVYHPDDRERASKSWNHSLQTGEPYEIEYRLRNAKTGQYRWFVGRARSVRDENGNIIRWYGTCTDIDDQKRQTEVQRFLSTSTKILASSLDYKKTLQEVAHMLVPNIVDWCHIQVFEHGELTSIALLHKDPKMIALAKEFQALRSDRRSESFERLQKTKKVEFMQKITDDMIRAARLPKREEEILLKMGFHSSLIAPLFDGSEVVGMITFVQSDNDRDFTEEDLAMINELADRASMTITNASLYKRAQEELSRREELEAQLQQTNEELEERVQERTQQLEEMNESLRRSNQELQDFAYVASHDLQEPLRKIQAFGNLLQEEYQEPLGEGSEYLDRIRNAAARMSTLIEDLLAFSRVTTKARPFSKVDLNEITREVLGDLEVAIAENDAVVTVKDLPTVDADPLQMRQLMQNLIGNALKFTGAEKRPQIKIFAKPVRKGGRMVTQTIYVEDNGIGFDEKYLDRIFSVFQRLHAKEHYKGTGIGLAICRKIVERHGGTITAKSVPNEGSTFIVSLPVAA